jgi:hypothetical protein
MPGLRQSDRRLAVALIEHFNRKTGRCDPGIDRLANLLGYCERTVIRATQKPEKAGLFRKVRHGGYSNRNKYEPNWSRFAELETAWRAKLKAASISRATGVSPPSGQASHLEGDNRVPQTCRDNLPEQTCSKRNPNEAKRALSPDQSRLTPIAAPVKPGDAALTIAERRWTDQLHQRFASMPITYGEVIEAIDPSMRAAATEAEMRRRGSGLTYILNKLKIPTRP